MIRFHNQSNKAVAITFSGIGCFGGYYYMGLVCEFYDSVRPGETVSYKYNWGVTETWVNVQDADKSLWELSTTDEYIAPCSDSINRYCYANHHTVSTTAYQWSDYYFRG